ncbi:AAA family ATPase [Candidatus Bipolaricaulota bacterium]|nr:AAA family ATPase [Candidatus Bipolaricaulota bacterium]
MVKQLDANQLRYTCDPSSFNFQTTAELEPLDRIIGQERAIEALKLGLGIKDAKNRYNIYVAGDPGTGKMSAVERFLSRAAADEPQPPDLCHVHNFDNPYNPRYLELPAGRGCQLRTDLEQLINRLQREIPSVFESDEFKNRSKKTVERFNQKRTTLLEDMEKQSRTLGFSIQRSPIGINTLPLDEKGEPLSQEDYDALPDDRQSSIRTRQGEVQALIQERLQEVARLEEDRESEMKELAKEAVLFMIEPHIGSLTASYEGLSKTLEFLDSVKKDIIENVDIFRNGANAARKPVMPMPFQMPQADPFKKYAVNVLVDNSKTEGAPVVVEQNATYPNLFGSVDRRVQMGVAVTDFTMIKPGSLHRANGGYLVLNANNLFRLGLSWEALKIAIKRREIHIEDPMQMLGYSTTEGLRPEPIPFRIKLVIIGSPHIYELLYHYDEDFAKLFNIKADFGMEMDRTPEHEQELAQFLGSCCEQDSSIIPFEPSGVAQMVEYATELTGDQTKLSCQFGNLVSIVKEASFWAKESGSETVSSEHVVQAMDQRDFRHNRIDSKIQEMIERGTIFVDTEGERTGQVNGLAVLQMGNYAFGKPSRITASVFTGKGGIIDIEREAKLGGKTHTKGIMILKGFLGQRFAQKRPLSFAASLAFEQSYSMIDGDSASSTELYAILSALSGLPIRQGLAVTGSVNQNGDVQPIGGVNYKIEGFFRVCKAKGLTGDQGVLIPAANIDNLMLHREVVAAVKAGQFHIYPVATIEEGIELLTGVPAGAVDGDGAYPADTVFGQVTARLVAIEAALKAATKSEDDSSASATKDKDNGTADDTPPEPEVP